MSATSREDHRDFVRVKIQTLWVGYALSLLIHAVLLWVWHPDLSLDSLGERERDSKGGPLIVQLSIPTARAPSPPPAARARPSRPVPAPRPAPPMAALNQPSPLRAPPPPAAVMAAPSATPVPVVPPPAPPAPRAVTPAPRAAPPASGDFMSDIEARRSARGETARPPAPPAEPRAPAAEDEKARQDRIVAANLGLQTAQTFGYDPKAGGGVFQIERMGYDYAEFLFFGWNRDIRRNTKQLIEVRKGGNSDIRIAVIRRMIEIIRANTSGDFQWISNRLGRSVTLSSRPADNAGLEEFLMREFFADPRAGS